MYILKEDLAYLENKYHRTDMPFDFFNHTAYHGLGYDESTGESDEQIEAARKPQKTLQVRVCGWNILFNQLTKEERIPISYAQKAFWNK